MTFPPSARVFISGAASGLGRALAVQLGAQGARLLLTDISLEGAKETGKLAGAQGASEVEVLRCDVTKPEDVEAAAVFCDQRWGGVDVVVNNAGVAAAGKVGEAALQDWEWLLRVNFWGVLHGCHSFVPRLKKNRGGYLLNVASAASFASLPEMGAYNVTKAAVVSLSETLATELADANIRVSVLCPTFFSSGLWESFRATTPEDRRRAEVMMRRSKVTADDVAQAALKGLLRGELHIVPQLDGRALWRLKRWSPGLYFWALRKSFRHLSERLFGARQESSGANADKKEAA